MRRLGMARCLFIMHILIINCLDCTRRPLLLPYHYLAACLAVADERSERDYVFAEYLFRPPDMPVGLGGLKYRELPSFLVSVTF